MADSGPDPKELLGTQLLEIALGLAREAGELLLQGRKGEVTAAATKSSPTDVVTAMDAAAEELIGRRLTERRPEDGLLAEEGSDRPGTSGIRWVVDPLDGTVNYLYRITHWCVSVAAEDEQGALVGVVHAPVLDLTWTAIRGGGAWRGGRQLRCSEQTDLAQAMLATGFGYEASRRATQAAVLARVLPKVRDVRRFGSAALDLCHAAEGIVDVYYERGLNPWDLAAGGLIAREAGVRVGGLDGRPADVELVVATPPALWEPLTALLVGEPRADTD
jgi:myo-inositol-1(or 4)-monophosphatase